MEFGENPRKVHNIASNQMDWFRSLNGPIIEEMPNVFYNRFDPSVQQVKIIKLINKLK